jgi:lysozyme
MTTKITTPTKPVPLKKGTTNAALSTLIATIAIMLMPLLGKSEGVRYKAYRDSVNVWTICYGHTAGVKAGDTATEAQCQAWFKQETTAHLAEAVAVTPNLVNNQHVAMAVGHLVYNGGVGSYRGSPIAVKVAANDWVGACNAFPGWWENGTFATPQKNTSCKPHPKKPGLYLCKIPGLVQRRLHEKQICQTGKW